MVAHRLPTSSNVSEDREYLIQCFEDMQASGDPSTIGEAGAMALQDLSSFWNFFYHIKLKKDPPPNPVHCKGRIQQFNQDAQKIG